MLQRRFLLAASVFSLGALALIVGYSLPEPKAPAQGATIEWLDPRRPLPALALEDAQGTRISLETFRGTPLLINFWATWCSPCVEELPELAALQEREQGTLEVLAISLDHKGFATITPYVKQYKLSTPRLAWDHDAKAFSAFGIRGLPTSFLVDKKGYIAARIEGRAAWLEEDFRALITRVQKE